MSLLIEFLLLFVLVSSQAANEPEFAYLKGVYIVLADHEGNTLAQIGNDPREKGGLTWDPWRKRLSYQVRPTNGELTRLVVVDLSGAKVAEVTVRPDVRPVVGLMIRVENSEWLPDGKIRFSGGYGPSNCEQFDLDVATMRESNLHYGYCGNMRVSPDGKHIAAASPVNQFVPEEERFQTLLLDDKEIYYGVKGNDDDEGLFIIAGPEWNGDSTQIAILEKSSKSGETAVVIVSLNGKFKRTVVRLHDTEDPRIAWVDTRVLTGKPGVDQAQVDSITSRATGVTSDVLELLDRRASVEKALSEQADKRYALVRSLGGENVRS